MLYVTVSCSLCSRTMVRTQTPDSFILRVDEKNRQALMLDTTKPKARLVVYAHGKGHQCPQVQTKKS